MDQTLSLRDAARQLKSFAKGRKPGIQDGQLLSLLRAGKLQAGFVFVAANKETWIAIPMSYWAEVTADSFRAIRVGGGKKQIGTYKVRIGRFAEQFITANKGPALNGALASALASSEKQYDVVISEPEFEAFRKQFDAQPAVSKGGRPIKESWRDVASILARMVLDDRKVTRAKLVRHLMAELRRAEVYDPPGADSLEELLKAASKPSAG